MCGYRPSFYTAIIRAHFILQGRMIKRSQVSRLCHLGRRLVFNDTMQRLVRGLKTEESTQRREVSTRGQRSPRGIASFQLINVLHENRNYRQVISNMFLNNIIPQVSQRIYRLRFQMVFNLQMKTIWDEFHILLTCCEIAGKEACKLYSDCLFCHVVCAEYCVNTNSS